MHNIQQAQRIADNTIFMYLGEVKEEGLPPFYLDIQSPRPLQTTPV